LILPSVRLAFPEGSGSGKVISLRNQQTLGASATPSSVKPPGIRTGFQLESSKLTAVFFHPLRGQKLRQMAANQHKKILNS
jgi:hypothetical protein